MKTIYSFIIFLCIATTHAFAEQQTTNDIVLKMQHDLNLSGDQVANITQIVDRYVMASQDLQKSIDDGTMNPSAADTQKQQIKAVEEQGISQYLSQDQLYKWRQIEQQQSNGSSDGDDTASDEYSNLPRQAPSQ